VAGQVNDETFDQLEAPDSGLAAGTPPEQATRDAAGAPPRVPPAVDVPTLQRAYTQKSQSWAAVTKALGLEKDTPVDVVTARLAELQAPRGVDDEPLDPDTTRRVLALENREWNAEVAIYGEPAQHARTFYEKVRSHPGMSPSEVVPVFMSAVEAAVKARMEEAPAAVPEESPPEQAPSFRQEAPMTARTTGGIDTTGIADLPAKERDQRVVDWLRAKLPQPRG